MPTDSPWLELEDVTFTPHIAGTTLDSWKDSVRIVGEAIREFVEAGCFENTVNSAALERA